MHEYAVTQLRPSYPAAGRSRTFPATPDQVREARSFLASVMGEQPATDAAVLCLSELVSNAILHSNSRRPGGTFTVRHHADGPAEGRGRGRRRPLAPAP